MFAVGDRVGFKHQISPTKQETCFGTVRFVGKTEFAPEEWLGVVLEEKVGKNDGSVKGKSYFQCEPGYGIFIKPHTAQKVSPAPSEAPGAEAAQEEEKAALRKKLAEATEERDVTTILEVFRPALRLGVDPKELECAFRTVRSEAQMSFMTEMESARHVAIRLSGALEEIEAKVTKHTQEKVDRLGAALEERVSEMLNARIESIADSVSKAVLSRDGHQEPGPGPGDATASQKLLEAPDALVQTVAKLEQDVRKLQAEAGAAKLQELEKKVTRDIKDLQQQLTQLAKDWDAEATQLVTQLERRISRQLSGDTDSEEKEERVPPHKEFLEGKEKPTSYKDALEQVGGEKKLEEFREMSTRLMESYKVAPEMAEVLSGDSKARLAYSVKLNYQKYVNNLDELIERCKKHQKVFFDKVKEIATKTGGKNCKPPLKSKERCEAKATFKYRDASGDVSWHRLTDIVRDTVVYGNLDDMYEGLKLMHEDGDLEIVEFNDRYFHPLDGGYRDLQLTVRISDIVCELQLNVAGMIYIKEGSGHRTFEVARELAAAVADTGTEAVKRAGNILKWGKDHLGKDATKQLQDILSSSEKPLLLKAAQTGNSQLMSIFLEHRANVNVQDKISGQTALHKAMEGGYERAMWLLLEHRAEVDTADANGIVPLMQGFLQLRSQPDSEFIGRTVCILSQVAGMVRLKAAQDNLKKVVHDKLKQNSQLLQYCQDGDEVSVLELLKNYADANSPNDKKERPLHKALSPIGGYQNLTERHLQICRLLVQFNADCNLRDEEGRTPLVLAVRLGSCEAVQILLQQNATAQTVQVEDVQYLLRPTEDPEVAQVQAAALKQLHAAGCDFTTPTARDELPTFFAARCNNTAALEALLEAKCDPDRPNANRDLAITAAARDGQTEAVRWLLEQCRVNLKDAQRALHAARAQPDHEELISLLEQKWTRTELPSLSSNLDKFGGRGGDEKDAEKIGFQRPLTAKLKEKEGRSIGRRYYELELLTTFDWIQAGWASGSFQGDKDLGKHREAWCWEGMLGGFMEKIRAGKAEQVRAQPWEPGDILGLALDYTEGKMQLSHQGNWYTEADYMMEFEPNGRDLYPAITTKACLFRLRLGTKEWSFKPPSEDYKPWADGVGEWNVKDEEWSSHKISRQTRRASSDSGSLVSSVRISLYDSDEEM